MTDVSHTVPCDLFLQNHPPETPSAWVEQPATVWSWSTAEPYMVTIDFVSEGVPVRWEVSRELLQEALQATTARGLGDVRAWSTSPGFYLLLGGPEGQAQVRFPRQSVRAFLADSLAVCPAGSETEHLRLDDVIAALLGG